mmetsp:Transcript_37230/g.94573  ORF Transcript_37230/g.94573 Transcript_37230/m.94573 type:complete len:133 (-) Transcript_37230:55-453(-)
MAAATSFPGLATIDRAASEADCGSTMYRDGDGLLVCHSQISEIFDAEAQRRLRAGLLADIKNTSSIVLAYLAITKIGEDSLAARQLVVRRLAVLASTHQMCATGKGLSPRSAARRRSLHRLRCALSPHRRVC